MSWAQTIVLSIVQGLTEFLPVSSSGHLNIVSRLCWGADAGASFTAVIQLGTELAVLVFFAKDIVRIIKAWFIGLFHKDRRDNLDYKMGWYVIVGTIPIGLIGFLAKDAIRDNLRSLWVTASVLVVFSFVFMAAEKWGSRKRDFDQLTMKDSIIMGCAQCLALIPGVSRSGGTISAGLFIGLKRSVATRYSFLLAIPAVLASGIFSLPDAFNPTHGQAATSSQLGAGVVIAFILGYISIAWLLKFVEKHSLNWFAGYRVIVGVIVLILLGTGVLTV